MIHEKFIKRAFELARQAVKRGNHPFGALLVRNGTILLEAENTVNEEHDCTQHAELNLVSQATRELGPALLSSSTLYTSTEPCPMCAGAIFWARIPRLVYGVSASRLTRLAGHGFDYASRDLYRWASHQVEVIGPVLEDEGLTLHQEVYGK